LQAGGRRFDPDRLHGAMALEGGVLVVTAMGLGSGRVAWASPLWGGVCGMGFDGVFFGYCESGSGAFLDAQDVSVGLGGIAVAVRFGRAWGVRDGLAWVV